MYKATTSLIGELEKMMYQTLEVRSEYERED